MRLDEVLVEYAHTLQNLLDENFVGMYLCGSLAIGDFDLTSDIDFIVAINQDLNDDELKRVQSAHSSLITRDSRWVKHLEYSFFPMEKLLTLSSPYSSIARNDSPERQLWYFNNGSSTLEKSDHDNTLVTRWVVREKSVLVLGIEPTSIMPVITANELRAEIKNSVLGWRKLLLTDYSPFYNRFHQAFFVLNYCRVLQDLYEGQITSKFDGVKWAKVNLDPKWHSLIDYCWEERQDIDISILQPADPEVFNQMLSFSDYVTILADEYQLPSDDV